MALINCPECNAEISNQANACPKCAYPINSSSVNVKVTEVQFRKKKYKLHRTIALTMFYLGLFAIPLLWIIHGLGYNKNITNGASIILLLSFFLIPISIVYLIIIKILIWWNHS